MKSALILLFALICISSQAQEFPDDWIGNYSGIMVIGQLHRPGVDSVKVDFELQPIVEDSSWTYKMTFNSDRWGTIVKSYQIVVSPDGNAKKYILDEKNGIEMQLTLMNNTFYGMYEVMGTMFITSIRYDDGDLYYDLFGAEMASPWITHSEASGDDESIQATSYGVVLQQTVLLKRQE